MMLTFKAEGGTEFFYDPTLSGEVWITTPSPDFPQEMAVTAVIPAADLIEFALRVDPFLLVGRKGQEGAR